MLDALLVVMTCYSLMTKYLLEVQVKTFCQLWRVGSHFLKSHNVRRFSLMLELQIVAYFYEFTWLLYLMQCRLLYCGWSPRGL